MGAMYAAVLFIGITNATSVQPVISIERFVSYRERAAGMYSALPFAFSLVIPVRVLSPLDFVIVHNIVLTMGPTNNYSLAGHCGVPLHPCAVTYIRYNLLQFGII